MKTRPELQTFKAGGYIGVDLKTNNREGNINAKYIPPILPGDIEKTPDIEGNKKSDCHF